MIRQRQDRNSKYPSHSRLEGRLFFRQQAGMKVIVAVVSEGTQKQRFEFVENDTLIFGRASDAHCRIPDDPYVSRYHFLLDISPPSVTFCDLGSFNATYLNGVKHGGRAEGEAPDPKAKRHKNIPLKNRDVIKVGKTELRVLIQGEIKPVNGNGDLKMDDAGASEIIERILKDMFKGMVKNAPPKIGEFEIIRRIGEGGFGAVYLAKALATGKTVALKTMLQTQAPSKRALAQFEREIETCHNLKHPHIVAIQKHGVEDNIWYFSMEYMEGGSLFDLMKANGGKLEVGAAIPLIRRRGFRARWK